MAFHNRWLIRGRFTTRSNLQIGSGTAVSLSQRKAGRRESQRSPRQDDPLVALVATDVMGLAYIPGRAIKGVVRSWLEANLTSEEEDRRNAWIQIFGSEIEDSPVAAGKMYFGGKAIFRDALLDRDTIQNALPLPHWKKEFGTWVYTSTTIDRQTRTAQEHNLFHEEFVPPGVAFDVRIAADNLIRGDQDLMSEEDDELLLLLVGLEAFNLEINQPQLGADTTNGCGVVRWELQDILHTDPVGLRTQLQRAQNTRQTNFDFCQSMSADDVRQLGARAKETVDKLNRHHGWLRVRVDINFDGPFLVNDSELSRFQHWVNEEADEKQMIEVEPDFCPLCDADGNPYLPARSLRGSLRSRAEKIVRSIVADRDDSLVAERQTAGYLKESLADWTPDADKIHPPPSLIGQLFGGASWASPLWVSDFRFTENGHARVRIPDAEALSDDSDWAFACGDMSAQEFVWQLDFENISRTELALLCYSLQPRDDFLHKLGLGKPLGLGTVEIRPVAICYYDPQRRYSREFNFQASRSVFDAVERLASNDELNRYENSNSVPVRSMFDSLVNCTSESSANWPSFEELREAFRQDMDEGIRCALEAIGTCRNGDVPVHYPQARQADDLETKLYDWFVNNDHWKNKNRQGLVKISQPDGLPTLARNERP